LSLEAGEGRAFLLRLDRADGLAMREEQVVRLAVPPKRELPDGDAGANVDVGLLAVLNDPPGLLEQRIDGLPGFLFWGERHGIPSLRPEQMTVTRRVL
jgi:hypothetical protein